MSIDIFNNYIHLRGEEKNYGVYFEQKFKIYEKYKERGYVFDFSYKKYSN
jgi:hypothetical protein